LVSTQSDDPCGGPAEVEKVMRVEMDEIRAKKIFWANTQSGDPSGGQKAITVEMNEIGAKKFFWLVLNRVTLLEDWPRSKK